MVRGWLQSSPKLAPPPPALQVLRQRLQLVAEPGSVRAVGGSGRGRDQLDQLRSAGSPDATPLRPADTVHLTIHQRSKTAAGLHPARLGGGGVIALARKPLSLSSCTVPSRRDCHRCVLCRAAVVAASQGEFGVLFGAGQLGMVLAGGGQAGQVLAVGSPCHCAPALFTWRSFQQQS